AAHAELTDVHRLDGLDLARLVLGRHLDREGCRDPERGPERRRPERERDRWLDGRWPSASESGGEDDEERETAEDGGGEHFVVINGEPLPRLTPHGKSDTHFTFR